MANIHYLQGKNFSGRTETLISLKNDLSNKTFTMVGELPTNCLSGLMPTVEDELRLHATNKADYIFIQAMKILEELDFLKYNNKNPFELSGGEQALLTLISGMLLKPEIFAVDSTIEQLHKSWRESLFNFFTCEDNINTKIWVADNRFNEYGIEEFINESPKRNREFIKVFQAPYFDNEFIQLTQGSTLSLDGITFNYPKCDPVLYDLTISFEAGKVYHLEGKNGAGKSTFAKIIAGILNPQGGEIRYDHKKVVPFNYPGKWAGYSFQNPDEQLFSTNVSDEVLRFKKKEDLIYTERRNFFLRLFGLNEIKTKHPGDLPFVMRKRITLAATLATDQPWIIFDEPTLGQDDDFCIFFISLIKSLTKKGKGIILITHSDILLKNLDHNKLLLRDGQIK
jgi:energy-coupling factor transport system ATP-binding protein